VVTQFNIKVNDFRAIREADIVLNGITVVSGENGCGKSTLSQLLYHTFHAQNSLELYARREAYERLRPVRMLIERLSTDGRYAIFTESWEGFAQAMRGLFRTVPDLSTQRYLLLDILRNLGVRVDKPKELSEEQLYNVLGVKVNEILNDIQNRLDRRDNGWLHQELERCFRESAKRKFEIYENENVRLVDNGQGQMVDTWIQDAIYIDTPFCMDYYRNPMFPTVPHWRQLARLMQQEPTIKEQDKLIQTLMTIIRGRIQKEDYGSLVYYPGKRKRGFPVSLCATGLKSLAILYQLLHNGCLSDSTLMVIDEPEVHLHPQWVVEYARMVVLIRKHLGVRFFIASHSPDMISALKHIGAKEKEDVQFYLAERKASRYTYQPLGQSVAPIFKSFNIALDRIEEYGVDE